MLDAEESGYPADACAPVKMSDSRGPKSTRTAQPPALRRLADRMEVDAAPIDAESAPELPPDLLRRIVLDSLRSHASGLTQWLRLSLVCRDWRSFLLGEARPNLRSACHLTLAYHPVRRPYIRLRDHADDIHECGRSHVSGMVFPC